MKRNATSCNAALLPVLIGVLVTLAYRDDAAQGKSPKQATPTTPATKRNAPPTKDKANSEKLVKVATIHVNDGAADKVRAIFKAAKLPVLVMGSKNYGVLVRLKDHDRALRILKADAKKQHYWIRLNP